MLFNSPEYLLFFVLIFAVSWALRKRTSLRIWAMLLASYYFYASNNSWLIVLILISTQIDFVVAKAIEDTEDATRRRRLLLISLFGNLGMLAFFKYSNFLVNTGVAGLQFFGAQVDHSPWKILLPVGISFYTFQSMSYTLDVYFRQIKAERTWSRFAFYVTFFPQLVAGPIMRASSFMPQIGLEPELDAQGFDHSLALVARGLLKKMVLADYFLAPFADAAFDTPGAVSGVGAWVGLYAFTFQIYFDFSGYTDIAIGCSRLLGFKLPDNFNLPYIAVSFSDFWRRWHISLSGWLRDYLYIPLGGNRSATAHGVYRNLLITMLLGGLWHGAAWHFVIWGALHGLYLVVERYFGASVRPEDLAMKSPLAVFVRRFLVFQCVVLTWLVFRAQDTAHLVDLIQALFGGAKGSLVVNGGLVMCVLVILGSYASQFLNLRWNVTEKFVSLPMPVKGLGYSLLALAVVTFNQGAKAFIYFQF